MLWFNSKELISRLREIGWESRDKYFRIMDNGAQRRGPITPAYDIAAKILLIGEAGVGKVQFRNWQSVKMTLALIAVMRLFSKSKYF